jgi:hypothetical protein
MAKVMMTIRAPQGPPTVPEIVSRYGLQPGEIDADFGVVLIDPADHAYTILVEPSAAGKIQPGGDWETSGPFSNPKIEPFGPPQ